MRLLFASLVFYVAAGASTWHPCRVSRGGAVSDTGQGSDAPGLISSAAAAFRKRVANTPEFRELKDQALKLRREVATRGREAADRIIERCISQESLENALANYWRFVNKADSDEADSILVGVVRDLVREGKLTAWAAGMLRAKVQPKTLQALDMAVNVTVELVLDYTEHPDNAGASKWEIMQQLIDVVDAVDQQMQELLSRHPKALATLLPDERKRSALVALNAAHAFPRAVLPAVAAVLQGFDPREDALVNAAVVAYAAEGLSREAATNLVAAVESLLAGGAEMNLADGEMEAPATAAEAVASPAAAKPLGKAVSAEMTGQGGGSAFDTLFANITSVQELGRSSFEFFGRLSESIAGNSAAANATQGAADVCERAGNATAEATAAAAAAGVRRNPNLPKEARRVLFIVRLARYARFGQPRRRQRHLLSRLLPLPHEKKEQQPVYLWGGQFAVPEALQKRKRPRTVEEIAEVAVALNAGEMEDSGNGQADGADEGQSNG